MRTREPLRKKILILYSTTDGHTKTICKKIQHAVENGENEALLEPIEQPFREDFQEFDTIIIGASIRYGKHHKNVYAFLAQHEHQLKDKTSAFFSVNLVARKPNRDTLDTNPYVNTFLSNWSWKPDVVSIFAGKIDYPKYGFFDRAIIRIIMYLTKGPTHPKTVVDYTDWQQVEHFGRSIMAKRKDMQGGM